VVILSGIAHDHVENDPVAATEIRADERRLA